MNTGSEDRLAASDGTAAGRVPPMAPGRTNDKAVASMVLAVVGLIVTPLSLILAPLAAYYGSAARKEIAARGQDGDGLALAGLTIGWVVSALWVLGIIAVIVAVIVVSV